MADAGISGELRAAIQKEAFAQTAKYTVAALTALIGLAAAGWWFVIQQKVDDYVRTRVGAPIGAIAVFDLPDKCPQGWEPFTEGEGRVIVGSDKTFQYRQYGGAPTATLTIDNIPAHQHETVTAIGNNEFGPFGNGDINPKTVAGGSFARYPTALTSPAGKKQPDAVKTMPPYIALRFCKKTS